MKRLVVGFCLFCVVAMFSVSVLANPQVTATGHEDALALPADKVLRIAQGNVEFEYHGFLPISENVEVYHHWKDETWDIPLDAVKVGFKEVVPIVLQGEIVRFDVYDPLYIRTMRVAISTDQFRAIEHEELIFAPTSHLYVEEKGTGRGFMVESGAEAIAFVEDGQLHFRDGHGDTWEFDQRLYLWSDPEGLIQINSFKRGTGTKFPPRYRGSFELTLLEDGERFLAINEVSLEDYLIQVVPSEMPFSWPLEALKAQAVAARTYAVAQALYSRQGDLGFHVADSTNSQVYNNQPEAERTTQALIETEGQILANADGTISSTYFYSTSPGTVLTDLATWHNTEGLALEGNSPWFRWKCTLTSNELTSMFQSIVPSGLGQISALEVESRDEPGRVTSLTVVGSAGRETIEGELNVRRALAPTDVQRVSDSLANQALLPSALFFLDPQYDSAGQLTSVTIYGGGSGHNLGMSQWGAKGMAEAGYDYLSILSEYYSDSHLITHSEQLRY